MSPRRSTALGASRLRVPSQLTRLVWIASRFAGVTEAELPDWAERTVGQRFEPRDWRPAVQPLRPENRRGRPRERAVERDSLPRTPALFDWLLVEDVSQLGLLSLLVEIANPALEPREGLAEQVGALPGIRHVIETRGDREIVALATVRDIAAADRLEAQVQELVSDGGGVRVRTVKHESQRGATATWLDLARQEAAAGDSGRPG